MEPPAPFERQNGHVISPEEVARFDALLWGIGFLIGLLALVLPHGPSVEVAGWAGVDAFAGLVSLTMFLVRNQRPRWLDYVLSVLALAAVDMAVYFTHRSPVLFAAGGLFVLPTIFTAAFYRTKAFLVYLAAQAVSSAVVMVHSGVQGAPAGWALVVGTTTVVGVVVHVLAQVLEHLAVTDPLTGLANRRGLEPVLGRELARCTRLGQPLSLAVMDLDHFKDVNDAHGHQHGDRLLTEVTQTWRTQLRDCDMLARAGGDEFVLLLPSTGISQALTVLGRLEESTTQAFSAGLAEATPGCTVEDMLRQADDACYQAKQTGGGCVVACTTAA